MFLMVRQVCGIVNSPEIFFFFKLICHEMYLNSNSSTNNLPPNGLFESSFESTFLTFDITLRRQAYLLDKKL